MSVLGQSIIAGQSVHGANGTSHAINPATGEALEPTIYFIGIDEIDQAARAGQAAFDTYRNTSPEERAVFLETIAANLDEMKQDWCRNIVGKIADQTHRAPFIKLRKIGF